MPTLNRNAKHILGSPKYVPDGHEFLIHETVLEKATQAARREAGAHQEQDQKDSLVVFPDDSCFVWNTKQRDPIGMMGDPRNFGLVEVTAYPGNWQEGSHGSMPGKAATYGARQFLWPWENWTEAELGRPNRRIPGRVE